MDQVSNGRFQSLWRLVIVLCTALALFTVILVSCTKAPKESIPAGSGTRVEDSEPAGFDTQAEDSEPASQELPAADDGTPET